MSLRLADSAAVKVFVTLLAVSGFIWLYAATIPDSRFSALPLSFDRWRDPTAAPLPGARVAFSATAYCKGLQTNSGVAVQAGAIAADPSVLPIGSVIDVDLKDPAYDGIYTVLDSGPEIKGRELDIYMWSCFEAMRFGRKAAHLTVLRLGWNPHATTPTLIERLFKRTPEGQPTPLPARPLPIDPGRG